MVIFNEKSLKIEIISKFPRRLQKIYYKLTRWDIICQCGRSWVPFELIELIEHITPFCSTNKKVCDIAEGDFLHGRRRCPNFKDDICYCLVEEVSTR